MKRAWLALAACIALALTSGGVASATVAAGTGRAVTAAEQLPDGDGPPGFWWGTDSLPVTVPGSAPYSMPHLGGAYGEYIGMTGNWAYWLGCTGAEHFLAYSATDNAQAHTDYDTYHRGVGSGAYWFLGGPGVDPNYNGSTTEASAWGARQAARALSDIATGAASTTRSSGWTSSYPASCPRLTTAGTASTPRRAAGW